MESVGACCIWILGSSYQWFVQTCRLSQVRKWPAQGKELVQIRFFLMVIEKVFPRLYAYLQMELMNSILCHLRCFMVLLIFVCPVTFLYTHLVHSLFSCASDCIFTCYRLDFGAFRFWWCNWWKCTLTSPG